MDEHEKFFFDLNGYLVVENALTPEEIAACNKAIDNNPDRMRIRPPEQSLSGESKTLKGKHGRTDLGGMLTWPKPWCQPFRDLLAHPNIVPYLAELLREDCRLDHLYGIVMEKGAEGHVIHGGGTADDLTHFYQFHNGRMRCGLTVVSWVLTDCNPGEGGFACIPGQPQIQLQNTPRCRSCRSGYGCGKANPGKGGVGHHLHRSTGTRHAPLESRPSTQIHSLQVLARHPDLFSAVFAARCGKSTRRIYTPYQRALLEPPYRTNRPRVTQ